MTTLKIILIYFIIIAMIFLSAFIIYTFLYRIYLKKLSSNYTLSELDSLLQSYEHSLQNAFPANKEDVRFYEEQISIINDLIEYKKKYDKK